MIRLAGDVSRILHRAYSDNISDIAEPENCPRTATSLPKKSSAPLTFRVLTQNTWGLPVAPLCHERLVATAEQAFARHERYDAICFQEVWHVRERAAVVSAARDAGLVYSHYFEQGCGFPILSGQTGTGLLVVSRWPIVSSFYHRYTISGTIYRFWQADYLGAKGFGVCRLATPAGAVDVITSHLLSDYSGKPGTAADAYHALRVQQAFELGRFLQMTVGSAASLTVVCGDFNMSPSSLVVRLITKMGGLSDAWSAKGCGSEASGITLGRASNPFSCNELPRRMDFQLWRTSGAGGAAGGDSWSLHSVELVELCASIPGGNRHSLVDGSDSIPLSDHAGVEAAFRWSPSEARSPISLPPVVSDADDDLQPLLVETHRLLREQVRTTARMMRAHQSRAWLAAAGWLCAVALSALRIWHSGWLISAALYIAPTYAWSEWLLACFPVATELGAVKEGLRGVADSLRALNSPGF